MSDLPLYALHIVRPEHGSEPQAVLQTRLERTSLAEAQQKARRMLLDFAGLEPHDYVIVRLVRDRAEVFRWHLVD